MHVCVETTTAATTSSDNTALSSQKKIPTYQIKSCKFDFLSFVVNIVILFSICFVHFVCDAEECSKVPLQEMIRLC